MIQFEGFEKLHIGLKSATISVLCYIPFFFVAIYMMKKSLIDRIANEAFLSDLDFWFLIALCIVFSIAWYLTTMVISLVLVYGNYVGKSDFNDSMVYILAMFMSVVLLSAHIFIYYYDGNSFTNFLVSAFTVTPIFCIVSSLAMRKLSQRKQTIPKADENIGKTENIE